MISIISTMASLIGAGIAIYQAKNAKSAARFAEKIKNKLEAQRVSSELYELYYSVKEIKKVISPYGPAATEFSLKGVNIHEDAQKLQVFLSLLKENQNLFKDKSNREIIEFCENLNALTEDFVAANSYEQMKKTGTEILDKLDNLTARLKKLIYIKEEEVIYLDH